MNHRRLEHGLTRLRIAVDQLRRALPMGLVGMIALVVSVEFYLRSRADDFTVDIAATWKWSRRSASHEPARSQILCFGDSLVKFGVVPSLIEEKAGRKAYNLAMFQGNPAASYLLLRRAIAAGSEPAALIVDGELLQNDPLVHPGAWSYVASPVEAAQLAWEGRDSNFLAGYALSSMFESVRFRYEIRDRIMTNLKGAESNVPLIFSLNWRNWQRNRGAFVMPSEVQTPDAALKNLESVSKDEAWKIHPTNRAYLDRFLDLASSRGIPVFWLFPPQHPAFVRHFDRPNYNEARDAYVRGLMNRHPNVIVVDGRHSGYDKPAMSDLSHLNRRGACAFSLALGEIVKARLDNGQVPESRWVALPTFREPGDLPVEDTTQSMIAVLKENYRKSQRR